MPDRRCSWRWTMSDPRSASPATRLEAAFTRVWRTRMAGLPFLNPALRVEAVGVSVAWLAAVWRVEREVLVEGGR